MLKKGSYRTEAIILNSFDYSESDRILAFYTREYGKIKGIAKGARRSKKRFVGNLEPLSRIMLIFFQTDKSELVRVEDSTLIEGFAGLKADIEKLSQACYLLELVSEMTREGQVNPAVYKLLLEFLGMGQEGKLDLLSRFFEIKLLSMLGYLPFLEGCVVCREEASVIKKFSSERGGMVCDRCSTGLTGMIPVSQGTAMLLSTAAKFSTDKLERLKPADNFIKEGERLLGEFIKFQLGKELKTRRFMDKLRNASV